MSAPLSDAQRDRLPLVRCGSCGQRATTTILLCGVTVPVCLRHLNVWKTPDFDADAAMLAEARAEGAAGALAPIRQLAASNGAWKGDKHVRIEQRKDGYTVTRSYVLVDDLNEALALADPEAGQ